MKRRFFVPQQAHVDLKPSKSEQLKAEAEVDRLDNRKLRIVSHKYSVKRIASHSEMP
ncbi:hypothetical protein [Acidovorax sp. BLS4]|uniref:hypothetical protein n=1 Tax=Acidovorax sp. BLS4 TaxID=3273430 RepID=UPI0029430336|nr:hypothetical protein [Paracidovorax avenae]WOI46524.1 hypothetical protein R1Z03_04715 [Paracidovorax avenae]